jgi:hypothetical protein
MSGSHRLRRLSVESAWHFYARLEALHRTAVERESASWPWVPSSPASAVPLRLNVYDTERLLLLNNSADVIRLLANELPPGLPAASSTGASITHFQMRR